jgi:hypothetical protein
MRKFSVLSITMAFLLGLSMTAGAINIVDNPSFETGDFTDWGTKDMGVPFYDLLVRPAGDSPGFSLFTSAPTDGLFAATHGFDGGGPDTIEIFQDIVISDNSTAILSFDWRAGWDMLSFGVSTLRRLFDVVIEPFGGGAPLLTAPVLAANPLTTNLDTGAMSSLIDLSAFSGSSIRLNFLSTIPEDFTGPAHLQIDNVSLDVQSIPEPGMLILLGSGLFGLGAFRKKLRKK